MNSGCECERVSYSFGYRFARSKLSQLIQFSYCGWGKEEDGGSWGVADIVMFSHDDVQVPQSINTVIKSI